MHQKINGKIMFSVGWDKFIFKVSSFAFDMVLTYVNVSIMLVACQVFGKLPLWGIQLDYLTFGCDNCYIRLWFAFLLCYFSNVVVKRTWWSGWSFSYCAKSII